MSMSKRKLASQIDAVVDRIGADLGASSPFLANQVLRWIRRISPGGEPAAHFLNVRMFSSCPILFWSRLPWCPMRRSTDR